MVLKSMRALARQIVAERRRNSRFIPGKTLLQYSGDVTDERELMAIFSVLLDGRLAMGKKAQEFERQFAEYIGTKETVAVSSGSDALLIIFQALMNAHRPKPFEPGDEVIACALNFATPISSLVLSHLRPVFVDTITGNYTMETDALEGAITRKTKAILATHLFGNVANMSAITKVAKRHNLVVIEDCCDAHGSLYNGRKVGSIGDVGAFSFYPAHGMTMGGEGGIISTDDENLLYIARSLRQWGRALPCKFCKSDLDRDCVTRHNLNLEGMKDYDLNYLFINLGFNSKVTEIQAAFGIEQLKKLDGFNKTREKNFSEVVHALKAYEDVLVLPRATPSSRPAWYTIPLTIRSGAGFTRTEMQTFLRKAKIEYRNLFAGNILAQPGFKGIRHRTAGSLRNAITTTTNSFFVGCYQGMTSEMREYMIEQLTQFLEKHR